MDDKIITLKLGDGKLREIRMTWVAHMNLCDAFRDKSRQNEVITLKTMNGEDIIFRVKEILSIGSTT